MLEKNLIRKTKAGRYYNVSFKKDMQTIMGEYGIEFIPKIKLEDFINLDTGEWIFNDHTMEVGFDEYCKYYLNKLKVAHASYVEKVESSVSLSEKEKKSLISGEYKAYNSEIHLCQLCQNAHKRLNELGVTKIDVLIPDSVGNVMFTPVCTKKPIKLLREYFGKKRYLKKISAVKLRNKMKRLCKSVYDINETTEIRISSLEKYTSEDCAISILNISLIASALKCSIEELTE